jgi:hypothetical protein
MPWQEDLTDRLSIWTQERAGRSPDFDTYPPNLPPLHRSSKALRANAAGAGAVSNFAERPGANRQATRNWLIDTLLEKQCPFNANFID